MWTYGLQYQPTRATLLLSQGRRSAFCAHQLQNECVCLTQTNSCFESSKAVVLKVWSPQHYLETGPNLDPWISKAVPYQSQQGLLVYAEVPEGQG
jgi:hypothetical protein